MFKLTNLVKLKTCLKATVKELLPQVPQDANSVTVIVYHDLLHDLENSVIEVNGRILKVRFDPVSENTPAGTVQIGFGQGHLE